MSADLYEKPRTVSSMAECEFYHTMEVPGVGLVEGQWDLREGVDDYLGGVDFSDTRVLEIGPASGFLTFHMERTAREVVAVDLPMDDDSFWDFVPYHHIGLGDRHAEIFLLTMPVICLHSIEVIRAMLFIDPFRN